MGSSEHDYTKCGRHILGAWFRCKECGWQGVPVDQVNRTSTAVMYCGSRELLIMGEGPGAWPIQNVIFYRKPESRCLAVVTYLEWPAMCYRFATS